MVGSLLNNINDPFARMETGQDRIDFGEFGGSKAFDVMGFADSEGAANGRAGTQEVDSEKLEKYELKRQKREERDKTNELIELGYQLRQSRTESVTVGGISLSIGEWQNIKDTLDDPAKLALVREQLRAEGKTDAEIAESEYLAERAADIAIKKHRGQELTPEEQAFEQRLESNPSAQQHIEDLAKASELVADRRLESDRGISEEQNAEVSNASDEQFFVSARAETLDASELVEDNLSVRDNLSVGDNPFADTRSSAADFNASASGVEIVAAAPARTSEPAVTPAGLSNG